MEVWISPFILDHQIERCDWLRRQSLNEFYGHFYKVTCLPNNKAGSKFSIFFYDSWYLAWKI